MKVVKHSFIPYYLQIMENLKNKIKNGKLKPGEFLPSEEELANTFNVSRTTTRKAIDELVIEGLVIKNRGKKSTIAPKKIMQPLNRVIAFSETVKNAGFDPNTKAIQIVKEQASKEIAKYLDLHIGHDVVKIQRLRMADNIPLSLITSYIIPELVPGIIEHGLINDSLYQTLKKIHHINLTKAVQEISARISLDYEADMFDIRKGMPLLVLDQVTYTDDRIIEYVNVISRADRYKYVTNLSSYPT